MFGGWGFSLVVEHVASVYKDIGSLYSTETGREFKEEESEEEREMGITF